MEKVIQLLPNGSLLRRLRDATEPLVVTNTQLPGSPVAPQVEEAAAVEVQLEVQDHQVSGHRCLLLGGRMPSGRLVPLLSSLNQLMQIYISSGQAPPNAALQGRLTQLGGEDDGICVIGIVIRIV